VTIFSNAKYKPFGPVHSLGFGNGLTLTQAWDDDYHLSGINTSDAGEVIQNLSYSDDPDGNIQTITDNLNGEHSQSLGYDDLNRVDSATGNYGSQTYQQYDGNGNRGTVTINGVQYVYNISSASNQIVTIAQTGGSEYFYYLPSGQVYSDQRNPSSDYQFSYDGYGHLASADLNSTLLATYGYNGFDQRAQKVAAATTDYLYDRAGHMIAEASDTTGLPVREYVWMDDTPVAMVDYSSGSAEVYDIHTDHLGRPQKLTDQSANLVWDGVYDPFGVPSGISGSVTMLLGFPGQYWDSETQLAQNWHRDYDPAIGRYVESDPIGLVGGVNTYVYVVNNPIRHTDRMGLAPVELGGSDTNKALQDLFGLSLCDLWPGYCVQKSVICVQALCKAPCGQYYMVNAWVPGYPTPKEVSQLSQNCHCVATQIDESIQGTD
jgi:RHS repeat-associated protein